MTRTHIFHSARFDLVSYGNGLSYALHDNINRKSLFVQGDDAEDFRNDYESWQNNFPEMAFDEIFARMMEELT